MNLTTYRDGAVIHHPIPDTNDDGDVIGVKGYRAEPLRSINAAKRASRGLQAAGTVVKRGKPG